MKDQRKCMVHFEDKGMFPKVHWRIMEDSRKVPSQNTLGVRDKLRVDTQSKFWVVLTGPASQEVYLNFGWF